MPPRDFREHLQRLDALGMLRSVAREVDTRFEIAAGIRDSSDTDGPALLFENIRGYPGWKVAAGLYATPRLLAAAMGLPPDASNGAVTERYMACMGSRVEPILVKDAPVKEVVLEGRDVDLTRLPVPVYSEWDSGPFLAAGVEIARHPETGVQNVSIHRRKILGPDRTAILAVPPQHLGRMIGRAEELGHGLPVATVIGVEPSLVIASQIRAPEGVDEAGIAGAFRGEPLELVRCETIDVLVPANAEIVIEGTTVPHERVVDGPFAEFPGNYATLLGKCLSEVPVIRVSAVTMRKDARVQAMLTGMPVTENHVLKQWALTAEALIRCRGIADVREYHLTPGGACSYHAVVSIQKTREDEPRRLIQALMEIRNGPKMIVVVDEDIAVQDPVDVEWAVATRMRADRDLVVDNGPPPKIGMDATAPVSERQWYRKARVPGAGMGGFWQETQAPR